MSVDSAATAGSMSDEFLETFLPGTSPSIVRLREYISRLNSPRNRALIELVLIRGESGTGKNHLAQVVSGHRQWRMRRNSGRDLGLEAGLHAYADRFHEIHLPALPEPLIESELFGHLKGAFTGADKKKLGLLADRNIDEILLDEIGDASLELQAKLLGVLESGYFRPLGANPSDQVSVNARLLMATNRSLEQLVAMGKFREDLYHRANLFVLHVPPLREQRENIEPIARRIEANIRATLAVDVRSGQELALSASDVDWARAQYWPGNIRELKHAIKRWFFFDGAQSLREIVAALPRPAAEHLNAPSASAASMAAMVEDRMNRALLEGRAAAGTLNEFVGTYEREVKVALGAWYQGKEISADQLQELFPGHKSVDSIRNKLSEWRPR